MAVGRLVALHDSAEAPLPSRGSVTIGRRATCTVVCADGLVSGVHCVLTLAPKGPKDEVSVEVEDRSTNGTYVNDVKVGKGQRAPLRDGDVLSLTKPPGGEDGCASPSGVRFRLVLPAVAAAATPLAAAATPAAAATTPAAAAAAPAVAAAVVASDGASSPTPPSAGSAAGPPAPVAGAGDDPPGGGIVTAWTSEGFAQDLLLQEQQSKAKITGELLVTRRRLEEERAKLESTNRELRRMSAVLEDERSRTTAAQESLERLKGEATPLRRDRQELEDLRAKHAELQSKQETVEVDVGTQQYRLGSLEAAIDRLRRELAESKESGARNEAQVAEVQARLQFSQERAGDLEARRSERRKRADDAAQAVEQAQRDLGGERAARERLEDNATLLRADVERAEAGKRSADEALEVAKRDHVELEGRVAAARSEAEERRRAAAEAQKQFAAETDGIEALSTAAAVFADSLRDYADAWARGLTECTHGCPAAPAQAAATASASASSTAAPLTAATSAAAPSAAAPSAAAVSAAAVSAAAPSDAPADGAQAAEPCGEPTGVCAQPTSNARIDLEDVEMQQEAASQRSSLGAAGASPRAGEAHAAAEGCDRPEAAEAGGDVPSSPPAVEPATAVEPAMAVAMAAAPPSPMEPATAAAPPSPPVGMLSMFVGSQDHILPKLVPAPREAGPQDGVGGRAEPMRPLAPGGTKRSATMSVLVMPGLQPAFKRERR